MHFHQEAEEPAPCAQRHRANKGRDQENPGHQACAAGALPQRKFTQLCFLTSASPPPAGSRVLKEAWPRLPGEVGVPARCCCREAMGPVCPLPREVAVEPPTPRRHNKAKQAGRCGRLVGTLPSAHSHGAPRTAAVLEECQLASGGAWLLASAQEGLQTRAAGEPEWTLAAGLAPRWAQAPAWGSSRSPCRRRSLPHLC